MPYQRFSDKKNTIPHTWHKCNNYNCFICEGGLGCCTVCKCLEGSLPTDCPGFDCYDEYGDKIYSGEIDFVNGKWVEEPSVNSPTFYRHVEA